jgi:signal transduction histidine kinase
MGAMMAVPASLSKQGENKNLTAWLKDYLKARAKNRDDAFRERTIRVTVLLIASLLILSFAFSILVFQDEWQIISFPTVHVFVLLMCVLSWYSLRQQKIVAAGWWLEIAWLGGAAATIVLASQRASISGLLITLPAGLISIIVAALVLPRSQIMIAAAISIVLNGVVFVAVQNSPAAIPGLDQGTFLLTTILLLLVGGTFLRQLRVEFDYRLEVMSRAIAQAEAARAQAEKERQRAEQADRAKSQFLANMSHELRTPLNAIIGYDEAMIGGMVGDFTPEQKTLLGHIQFNSRRLLALIDDVLDLAKIESGSLQVYLAPMSPRKVIGDLINNMQSLSDKQKIFLKVDFAPEVPEVTLGDSRKLQQILTNLVGNAVKFTSTGGVTVAVDTPNMETWRIKVMDTGIGMPPDAATYIFEPFRQVDGTDTRKYKGTGLGLSITKRLADALNGSISVETELGKGTTFTVVLPRLRSPEKTDKIEKTDSQTVAAPTKVTA